MSGGTGRTISRVSRTQPIMKKPVVLNKKKKYSEKAKKAYFSGKGDSRTDLENMIVMR